MTPPTTPPEKSTSKPAAAGSGKSALAYREAGVDTEAGSALVERIKPLAASTATPGVVAGLGGFGALFEMPLADYDDPLIVAGTDGVGTKLRLAIETGRHDTVGIDLVAMCANDILAQGAKPLFFLDYFAAGKLDLDVAEAVVRGIAEGCRQAGAALIGGETAEMPGMYRAGDYDLAGFCVGIVERSRVVDGRDVAPGDVVVGLVSSGPHSNGYSLIRKILRDTGSDLGARLGGQPLADRLLEPTRIYVDLLGPVLERRLAKGIAHITGGGLIENVSRVLPSGTSVVLRRSGWPPLEIFEWLREAGRLTPPEMHRTFNCGIGLVLVCDPERLGELESVLDVAGERAYRIGEVVSRSARSELAVEIVS